MPPSSGLRPGSTPPFTRRLPTGKSIEDSAQSSRVQSTPPPHQVNQTRLRNEAGNNSLKVRADQALELWKMPNGPPQGETEDPMRNFYEGVVMIARRGRRFAHQVLVAGSFAKAKSGIRSYERLSGGSGTGIGQSGKGYFFDAVRRYKRAKSGGEKEAPWLM